LLLEQGAKVYTKDINEWSALMIASTYGYIESVSLLLGYGANVNDTVKGWSALMIASQNDNTKLVQVLFEYGANVNNQVEGWSPLMIACYYEHSRLASILLEQNANVDLRNRNGFNLIALMIARQQGHTVIVQELLMQKLNDLLISASEKGHAKIAELLLKQGASVNVKDADGKTALMFACEKGYTKTSKVAA
jgi:ankyrin repeat protein